EHPHAWQSLQPAAGSIARKLQPRFEQEIRKSEDQETLTRRALAGFARALPATAPAPEERRERKRRSVNACVPAALLARGRRLRRRDAAVLLRSYVPPILLIF